MGDRKMTIWKEGDRSKGICPKCKELKEIVFKRRSFYLKKTKRNVKDVLLGVCAHCDGMVSVPPQSAARLKEARSAERKPFEVRISSDVKDIVFLVVDTLGAAVPQSAFSQLFRNYLVHLKEEPKAVRHALSLLKKAAFSKKAPSKDRISIKLSPSLDEIRIELHSVFESDVLLVKGIVALSKDEILDHPNPKRIKELKYSLLQAA
jgi:hypothetical protein